MVKKEAILAALNDLPEEVTVDEILERLAALGGENEPAYWPPVITEEQALAPPSWRSILQDVAGLLRMQSGREQSFPLSLLSRVCQHRRRLFPLRVITTMRCVRAFAPAPRRRPPSCTPSPRPRSAGPVRARRRWSPD